MSIGDPLTLSALFVGAPHGGPHRFAGRRACIIDTALMGLSRRMFIADTGLLATKRFMLRMGYLQGWQIASHLATTAISHPAGSLVDIARSLLALSGFSDPPSEETTEEATVTVARSCEAEEHLRSCGPSDEPVCWFTAGFMSGYLSRTLGLAVVCREEQCSATGHATCTFRIDVTETTLDVQQDALSELDLSANLLLALTGGPDAHDGEASPATGSLPAGTRSVAMRALLMLARRASPGDTTILITGESGVGKEFLARDIHNHSDRARGSFVPVNCGAIPETLLESEFFGHTRGAFTGAVDKPGLFESAHRGTLFLDEIGELRLDMQVKLLRVLQDHELRRLGDVRTRPIDIRVIAATNRDLSADVAAKRFREDLYYRLAVVRFQVPPLREREEDVRDLIDLFLHRIAKRRHRPGLHLTPRARAALLAYHWPGNVRELDNALESASALTVREAIDLADLPAELRPRKPGAARPGRGSNRLADVEREHIFSVMQRVRGNRTRAAAELGIGIKTLYRKLRHYRWQAHEPASSGHNDRTRSE